jgi:hypothetical protein
MARIPSFSEAVSKSLQQETNLGDLGALLVVLLATARKRFIFVTTFLVLGGILGWLGTFVLPPVEQKAVYMIATDEEGSSPAWESLLAQFGLDVGGGNPAGVFQGESLVALFQTRTMVERALLQKVLLHGDSVLLATEVFKRTKHSKKPEFAQVVFAYPREKQDVLADSALYLTYKYVLKKMLSVVKPEKKQTFIHVSCTDVDPAVATAMSTSMISTVTGFYVETLTQKARTNLDILRNQADSVQRTLNRNLSITAELGDENINPWRQSARTGQNRAVIDLQISMAVFGELNKNLQLAEIGLRKQTPLIQIIESPTYPLEKVGLSRLKVIALGLLLGLIAAFYFIYKQLRNQVAEKEADLVVTPNH